MSNVRVMEVWWNRAGTKSRDRCFLHHPNTILFFEDAYSALSINRVQDKAMVL